MPFYIKTLDNKQNKEALKPQIKQRRERLRLLPIFPPSVLDSRSAKTYTINTPYGNEGVYVCCERVDPRLLTLTKQ